MLSLNHSVYFGGTQLHPISTRNITTFQKIYLSSNKHNFNPFQVRTQMGKLRLNLQCYDENKNPSKLLKKVTYLRGQDTWFSFPSEMCKIVQFRRLKETSIILFPETLVISHIDLPHDTPLLFCILPYAP